MTVERLVVAVEGWDWESRHVFGEGGKIVGHEIRVGSIIQCQLSISPRDLIKHWARRPTQERTWIIDPSYDLHEVLSLGVGSQPVGRTVRTLREGTNLVYFEGVVAGTERALSKGDKGIEFANLLLDCGLPIVFEALVRRGEQMHPALGKDDEVIGLCKLWAHLSYSRALFKAPSKFKVVEVKPLDTLPEILMLTLETALADAPVESRPFYSRFD